MEIYNKLIDVKDLEKHAWKKIIDEMHHLMKVPARKTNSFQHCTDRKSLIHRAEIESYKHWEYPWAILYGAFEPGMKVLDCGCGRGFLQIYLALKGCNVSSVDISTLKTRCIKKLWHQVSKYKLPIREDKTIAIRNLAKRYNTTIDFHVASISRLPFENEQFDRVYSISVLEHMKQGEDEKAVMEMSRVLKIGGKLLVTVDFSPKPVPRRSYNEKDIHRLIGISGLKILGEYNYRFDSWEKHLNDIKQAFSKPQAKVSSAGFVLVKDN